MQCGVEIVERPSGADEAFGCVGSHRPRVRQRRRGGLQRIQVFDALLVGNGQEDDVPPLLRATDGEYLDARRGGSQRPGVGIGLLRS
jgi:hypothetical protein